MGEKNKTRIIVRDVKGEDQTFLSTSPYESVVAGIHNVLNGFAESLGVYTENGAVFFYKTYLTQAYVEVKNLEE